MDTVILCNFCHSTNDPNDIYCFECGCLLDSRPYLTSFKDTKQIKVFTFERKKRTSINGSFTLENDPKTGFFIQQRTPILGIIILTLLGCTVAVVQFFFFVFFLNINEGFSMFLTVPGIIIVFIGYYALLSMTIFVSSPKQGPIGKIVVKNLALIKNWTFFNSTTNEQFQLTFSSKNKAQLQMHDQSYSIRIRKKNRYACLIKNSEGVTVLRVINESLDKFPVTFKKIFYSICYIGLKL